MTITVNIYDAKTRLSALVSSVAAGEEMVIARNGKPVARLVGFASHQHDLPFTSAHPVELSTLPWQHRDPFDRMLLAQARVEHVLVVSVDSRFRDYDVQLLPGRPAG